MPQLARQSAKGRRVPWSGGAVQVEEAADVDVARLARIEAVEGFDLHSGEEMRHGVAGGDHRARVPRAHLGRRQQWYVGPQLFSAAAVEQPGRPPASPAGGSQTRRT